MSIATILLDSVWKNIPTSFLIVCKRPDAKGIEDKSKQFIYISQGHLGITSLFKVCCPFLANLHVKLNREVH